MKSGSMASYRAALSGTGADIGGEPDNDGPYDMGRNVKCGVTDCQNLATCFGTDEEAFPCCDEHCSHDGDGSENCTKNKWKQQDTIH